MINIYTANIVNSVNIYNLFENIFFYAKQKQALVDKPDGSEHEVQRSKADSGAAICRNELGFHFQKNLYWLMEIVRLIAACPLLEEREMRGSGLKFELNPPNQKSLSFRRETANRN